jgi:hypothetical protein
LERRLWLRDEKRLIARAGRVSFALPPNPQPHRGRKIVVNVPPWANGDELRALSDGEVCYSWELRLMHETEHIPVKGQLNLFEISYE